MNWVAPIKDDETFRAFEKKLREVDDKYYILFELGVGTGLQLQDILKFKVNDIRGKEYLEVTIGSKNVKRTYHIPQEVREVLESYTKGKDPASFLFLGHNSSPSPLSREQAYRVLKNVGKELGLTSIGAQTMRKTFAWRYYHATGDIYYLQNLLNHAAASITYRYIGEIPPSDPSLKKQSPEENRLIRERLQKDDYGKKRIDQICDRLDQVRQNLDAPGQEDIYYGKVDNILRQIEMLTEEL